MTAMPDIARTQAPANTVARLVLGTDLQLIAVRRQEVVKRDPAPVHIAACDGDGNVLGTLAVLQGIQAAPDGATLTLAADTARALWPENVHARRPRSVA